MTNLILVIILLLIIGGALVYIIRGKKKGVKCIGCPDGCNCSGKSEESSGCGCEGNSKMS